MAGSGSAAAPGFFDRVTQRAQATGSLLCVGLDPRAESADALRDECRRLIEATADVAVAYKPNSAFFEAHGPEGMLALLDVIASVPEAIPVLLDAKRGDIDSTSAAYAQAVFDRLGAGALTVTPYVGMDGLAPFLERLDRAAFVLCKTSNPGADEFQGLPVRAGAEIRPLYEVVAQHAQAANVRGNIGLVVGASDAAAMARVRALAPELWFLVPGIGAQGGDLTATLAAGLRADGLGLLINASRSLSLAPNPRAEARRLAEQIDAVRAQVLRQRESLGAARGGTGTGPGVPSGQPTVSDRPGLDAVAAALVASGCVRFGRFTLKSGGASPIYLDLRRLVSHPPVLRRVAQAYAEVLAGLKFDRLAGLPYAALPIATAISLEMECPLIYPRREAKDYGTRAAIEGDFNPGETAVVIDDLATTGGTKLESIEKLTAAGLKVRDIVVLVDREQGAGEALAAAGYRLHAIAPLRGLLAVWRQSGAISAAQADEVEAFLGAGT
jgi:uridine monophosphate synthetase